MFDRKNEGRWWDFGWQLIEGCTKISPACDNCWSLAKEKRFRKEKGIVFHNERLDRPLKRKKPTSYAIWNDLFHESVKFEWVRKIFEVIHKTPQHTYQILTKRPHIMLNFFQEFYGYQNWDNVWLGVTCENQEQANKRIPVLLEIPAKVRFVSVEPMLSEIDLTKLNEGIALTSNSLNGEGYSLGETYHDINNRKLDWVICGGESGHHARHIHIDWVRNLINQCKEANVPFFFKQGSQNTWKNYKDFDSFPEDLKIRQFPKI